MFRFLSGSVLTLAVILAWSERCEAQVFVRAPFVRVFVGGPSGPGVGVRAPFVNIWVPNRNYPPGVMYLPPPPPPATVAPAPPSGEAESELAPAPRTTKAVTLTLEQFAKSFQARPGSHEVTLVNPVTKTPTTVRFLLPDGAPRNVDVRSDRIVFQYGRRHFVRIDFDDEGAIVTSR